MDDIRQDVKEIKNQVLELVKQGASNTAILEYHVKRTDLNESRIAKLEYWLLGILASGVIGLALKLI